jgi:hypothetical protein
MPLATFRATCLCPNWSFRISCKLRCLFSASARPGDLVWIEYAGNKVPLQGRLAEGLRITSTHPSGCTPPQGRPLSMGEVLLTTARINWVRSLYLLCRHPEQFETRPVGHASQGFLAFCSTRPLQHLLHLSFLRLYPPTGTESHYLRCFPIRHSCPREH